MRDEIIKAQNGRNVPIFLVGTKKDLDTDRAVSDKERLAKARQWGPTCQSFEVSSRTNEGVAEVFDAIVKGVLATSTDPLKGGGAGSVLGAGRVVVGGDDDAKGTGKFTKPRTCVFL